VLAKEIASLDMISGGRVELGIGAGWNVEEMENHGAQFKRRWKIVREKILAIRQIWTQEAAEFHGEFVNFDPIWSFPKPVQPGGPPILLGSQSKRAFERIAEYCDGWMPINFPRADFAAGVKQLRDAEKSAGRKKLGISMFGASAKEDEIRRMTDLGFDRLIFSLPAAPRETVLPLMDKYAGVAAKMH
jgi:probable F420-dependent oxidoreductase